MGNYNPYAPIVVGQEWVPIRDESLGLSPAQNVIEYGHGFTLATPRQVGDARFYINAFPPGEATGQVFMASVYPRGLEDQSGPIQRIVIPCSAGVVSGTAVATGNNVAAALADPSDEKIVGFPGGVSTSTAVLWFGVQNYAQALAGKRIVGVNFLCTIAGDFSKIIDANDPLIVWQMFIQRDTGSGIDYKPPRGVINPLFINEYTRVSFGELNPVWDISQSASLQPDRMPWNLAGLLRFEPTATTKQHVRLVYTNSTVITDNVNGNVYPQLQYAALEVLYCNETRVAYASRAFGAATLPNVVNYVANTNIMPMRAVDTFAASPVLAAGDYTLSLSSPDIGDYQDGVGYVKSSTYPGIEALRELVAIPPHPGVKTSLTQVVGQVFNNQVTHILPHLSLHVTGTGAPLTEPHVYGRQAVCPVWGSVYAEAEINDDVVTVSASYPQVRFYARRFGDTTQPLVLTNQAVPANTVSLPVTDFDALDELVDGWKEVTLRFTVPPTIVAAAGSPDWRWTSTLEKQGSRWEVLGVSAPAVSGIPGNSLNLVPSAQRLDTATYDGTTTALTWASPYVSGSARDTASDGVILFSLDPPVPGSLAVAVTSQAVSGVGSICGTPSSCVPSGIGFHRVTWSRVTGIIVSGFGGYELQRADDVDVTWQTIMLTTSPTVTGFNDYEARVGILSSYRIRTLNVYDFAGQWSSTVTSTLPAPGVSGARSARGALIFTTNEVQDGTSNLAYVESFDRVDIKEDIIFPEADTVALQRMYGKDFQTAFRPSERGGESFTRTLLLQNAAVSTHALDRVADGLRNLAWRDLPYVCVRTEEGDRWFATVIVPDIVLRKRRQLQLVRVAVIESTDTPSPVNTA